MKLILILALSVVSTSFTPTSITKPTLVMPPGAENADILFCVFTDLEKLVLYCTPADAESRKTAETFKFHKI